MQCDASEPWAVTNGADTHGKGTSLEPFQLTRPGQTGQSVISNIESAVKPAKGKRRYVRLSEASNVCYARQLSSMSRPECSNGSGASLSMRLRPSTVMILGSFGPSMILFRLPLIQALRQRGCNVVAAVPLSELGDMDRAQLSSLGVVLVDAPVARHSVSFLSSVVYTSRIAMLMKRHRVDAVVSYTVKPVIFGTFAARIAGVKKIVPLVTGLGSVFTGAAVTTKQRTVRAILSRLYKAALAIAGCAFFQNPDDPRDLAALGGLSVQRTRVETMPGSGVDLRHYAVSPLPSASDGIVFLMIARIIADKGVREFAEAAALLRQRSAGVRCILVGPFDANPSGVSRAELQSWNDVEYFGPAEDVRPLIASCHVYVLPSYREGTPRSVLEAMAMGRPIVTTDAPGCRETVVNGDNGFLVPVSDGAALAVAMQRFINAPELIGPMGARSRQIAENKYDADRAYDGVLRELGW
jgi:glycosyltransferase involved in cell wall biosynthesis